jgi:predicted nucleic acid-binding protein
MLYLDANILLYPMLQQDARASACRAVLDQVVAGAGAATSVLTWDEVVYVLRKVQGAARAAQQGRLLLQFPGLCFLSTDMVALRRAQKLMDQYGLKPRDAIHAATALIAGIRDFVSEDADFDAVTELRRWPAADLPRRQPK